MATVYRGFDVRLQVPRAVKVLAPSLAGRRALRERFEAEARTMALFDHPNIVRVVDVGMDGDRVYIIMDLVSGGSLLERVRDFGPLPPRLALDVMLDVLRALQVAHEHGVVHRDIKPHNILLTEKGQVRVTDFGIARLVEGDEIDDALTRTGAVMGTWGFMAPEQKENAKAVDVRADLYSAGATLWAIATNQTPGHLFAADLDASMMQGVPSALADLIKRATRFKREDRFATAAEMLEAATRVREQLQAPPADTPPLGARAPVRPTLPTPPAGTVAEGPRPPAAKGGTTMVPDLTPAPVTPPHLPPSLGAGSDIEVDSSTWGLDADDVSRWGQTDEVTGQAARRQFRAFVLLGVAAVTVAVLVALALPRTLEQHHSVPAPAPPAPVVEPASTTPIGPEEPAAEPTPAPTPGPATTAPSPVARSPASARAPPTTASHAPSLSHTPIRTAKAGSQLQFKAKLTGASGYGEVLLNYRALGATVWSNQPMYAQGDMLIATLSISGPLAQGFEYFILARSSDGEQPPLSAGSFRAPYQVAVQ